MANSSFSICAYWVSAGVIAHHVNATGWPNRMSAAPSPDQEVSHWIVTSSLNEYYLNTGSLDKVSFSFWKNSLCGWLHTHSVSCRINCHKGSVMSDNLGTNFARYVTMPINLCTAAASSGSGIFRMAWTFSGCILSPSPEDTCLINGTFVVCSWIFSLFNWTCFSSQCCRNISRFWLWS